LHHQEPNEVYHLTKNYNDKLFDSFFEQLVVPSFPQISEVIPFDIWKNWVQYPDLAPMHIEVYLSGSGFDTDSPILTGFSHFEWYRSSECALAGYAAVSPEHRGKGISSKLLQLGLKEMSEKGAKAVFAEINDPARTVEDSMDPLLRLKVWQNLGIKRIDVPYYQPSLGEGQDAADNLWLCLMPMSNHTPISIRKEIVYDFLLEMFGTLQVKNPEVELIKLLDGYGDDLSLIELRNNS
jgi:GNAT superfamily N-acetyltransferase